MKVWFMCMALIIQFGAALFASTALMQRQWGSAEMLILQPVLLQLFVFELFEQVLKQKNLIVIPLQSTVWIKK